MEYLVTTSIDGTAEVGDVEEQGFAIEIVASGLFEIPLDAQNKIQEDNEYMQAMNLRFINRMYPATRELLVSTLDKIHILGVNLPWHIDQIDKVD